MARVTLESVNKHFGTSVAVEDFTLDIPHGSFLAVLGPSGCGKSTVLRLVAGFERVSSGQVLIDGNVVSGPSLHVPAEKRHVGIVFQSYALWPHMTVEGNVGYPLRVAKVRGEAYRSRVAAALDMVGLSGFDTRRPSELSGGQRQRVALARCLVMEPSLVLLDEPLANLDVHLRASMEDEFRAFHAKTGATMIYVTHDQAEAMALAERIAVMDKGRLVQVADPHTLYSEPATTMVAGFIGKGALADAEVLAPAEDGRCRARLFGMDVMLRCQANQPAGKARVCLRPEDVALASEGVPATVRRATYKGGVTEIEAVPESAPDVTLLLIISAAPMVGTAVKVRIDGGWVIPAP
ncbi:MAG: ABC transporter ATP-binding protein [Burkholderiales bacterium]|nr:ABC transporter ATP-binding protein [Burkholderiales bacterium]MDP2399880.1 ABC transporter ATP-binding protein [Burkholderiales bacterium]